MVPDASGSRLRRTQIREHALDLGRGWVALLVAESSLAVDDRADPRPARLVLVRDGAPVAPPRVGERLDRVLEGFGPDDLAVVDRFLLAVTRAIATGTT